MKFKKILKILFTLISIISFIVASKFYFQLEYDESFGLALIILVHELGHYLIATKKGIKIKLFFLVPLLGGAIIPKDEIVSVNDNAFLKAGGPMAGLILDVIFLIAFIITRDSFFSFMIFFNTFINLLNLLPIIIFDGYGILGGISVNFKYLSLLFLAYFSYKIEVYTSFYFLTVAFILFESEMFVDNHEFGFRKSEFFIAIYALILIVIDIFFIREEVLLNFIYLSLGIYFIFSYLKESIFKKKDSKEKIIKYIKLNKKQKYFWFFIWLFLVLSYIILYKLTGYYFFKIKG